MLKQLQCRFVKRSTLKASEPVTAKAADTKAEPVKTAESVTVKAEPVKTAEPVQATVKTEPEPVKTAEPVTVKTVDAKAEPAAERSSLTPEEVEQNRRHNAKHKLWSEAGIWILLDVDDDEWQKWCDFHNKQRAVRKQQKEAEQAKEPKEAKQQLEMDAIKASMKDVTIVDTKLQDEGWRLLRALPDLANISDDDLKKRWDEMIKTKPKPKSLVGFRNSEKEVKTIVNTTEV